MAVYQLLIVLMTTAFDFGAPVPLAAQAITLKAHIQKSVFFEDEPVYLAIELLNVGQDTTWLPPYLLVDRNLQGTLSMENGKVLPYVGLTADFVPGRGWPGLPVPPGEAVFDVVVLQDYWGGAAPAAPNLLLHHLGIGTYDLKIRLGDPSATRAASAIDRGATATEVSTQFTVRRRTPPEERLFREVKDLVDAAWMEDRRSGYLLGILTWVETHLDDGGSNPYLPFLMHNGLQIARGIGLRPDRALAGRIDAVRERMIRTNSSAPSSAYVFGALAYESPERARALLPQLNPGLAVRAGTALQRTAPR